MSSVYPNAMHTKWTRRDCLTMFDKYDSTKQKANTNTPIMTPDSAKVCKKIQNVKEGSVTFF